MITKQGDVMLCDFGFASELHGHGYLRDDYDVGTRVYMAPEIWNAKFGIYYQGKDADLFALGVTLFMGMFKRPPF